MKKPTLINSAEELQERVSNANGHDVNVFIHFGDNLRSSRQIIVIEWKTKAGKKKTCLEIFRSIDGEIIAYSNVKALLKGDPNLKRAIEEKKAYFN